MSDERLRELLSVLPKEGEIAEGAARARRRALARLGEPAAARGWGWVWAPAMVVLAAVLVAGWWTRREQPAETMAWTPPAPAIEAPELEAPAPKPVVRRVPKTPAPTLGQQRLELHLVLSDGTRVQWILDKDFSL